MHQTVCAAASYAALESLIAASSCHTVALSACTYASVSAYVHADMCMPICYTCLHMGMFMWCILSCAFQPMPVKISKVLIVKLVVALLIYGPYVQLIIH